MSPLASMLKEELLSQRVFLSSDEEAALSHPVSYDDETDLAWDRIKHRRLLFFTALRERFIRDRRPMETWRQLIREEEARVGEPTFVTALAAQVLGWAVRTSDRSAMLGGFTSKLLNWIGLACLLLGAYGWFQGATTGGLVFVGAGIVLLIGGRVIGNLTAERTAALIERARTGDQAALDPLPGHLERTNGAPEER